VREFRPDVVLLDIRMPGVNGIEAARAVSAETKVLMLTTFDVDEYVYDALKAGASGFLLKDVRRDDLAHAVRVIAGGESLLAPSVTRKLIARFTSTDRPDRPDQAAVRVPALTVREQETLALIARGLSNAEVAEAMVVSEHTVKTHVSNVLSKLGLRDRVQAVIAAYEFGLAVPGAR
jgi:DNA-binding NarL/FixJ family response regulator